MFRLRYEGKPYTSPYHHSRGGYDQAIPPAKTPQQAPAYGSQHTPTIMVNGEYMQQHDYNPRSGAPMMQMSQPSSLERVSENGAPDSVARRINFSNEFSEQAANAATMAPNGRDQHNPQSHAPASGPVSSAAPHTTAMGAAMYNDQRRSGNPGVTPARPPSDPASANRRQLPSAPGGKTSFENVWHVGPSPGSQPVLCVDV